jgi:hypothetical protein
MNHFILSKHFHAFNDQPINHHKIILRNIPNFVLFAHFLQDQINGIPTNQTAISIHHFLVEFVLEQIVFDEISEDLAVVWFEKGLQEQGVGDVGEGGVGRWRGEDVADAAREQFRAGLGVGFV